MTIGIFINPGSDTDAFRNDTRDEWITYPLSRRALEYDSLGVLRDLSGCLSNPKSETADANR